MGLLDPPPGRFFKPIVISSTSNGPLVARTVGDSATNGDGLIQLTHDGDYGFIAHLLGGPNMTSAGGILGIGINYGGIGLVVDNYRTGQGIVIQNMSTVTGTGSYAIRGYQHDSAAVFMQLSQDNTNAKQLISLRANPLANGGMSGNNVIFDIWDKFANGGVLEVFGDTGITRFNRTAWLNGLSGVPGTLAFSKGTTDLASGAFPGDVRMGVKDNGSGKLQLKMIWPSGRQSVVSFDPGVPTVAVGAALGTGSPSATISGSDVAGKVTTVLGTTPTTGALATVTLGLPAIATPNAVTLTAANAAAVNCGMYVSALSTTAFTVSCVTAPATAPVFYYRVSEA